jgi:hypothetical protein
MILSPTELTNCLKTETNNSKHKPSEMRTGKSYNLAQWFIQLTPEFQLCSVEPYSTWYLEEDKKLEEFGTGVSNLMR